MTTAMLSKILLWCLLINMGIMLWWFVFFMFGHDWMYKLHGKWFKLSVEQFDAIHYSGMAFYKICIFIFNLVPYLALCIVSG